MLIVTCQVGITLCDVAKGTMRAMMCQGYDAHYDVSREYYTLRCVKGCDARSDVPRGTCY